jgi:hypothetical protein
MKKMKNAMLVIAAGLLTVTVATISCSKKDSGTVTPPTAPAISSISPASAAVGATITVTGTNFSSPATVTFNGVSTPVTATGVSSTSLTVVVPAGATTGNITVTTGTLTSAGFAFTVTSGSGSGPTSDSVATANLIAHWTFDGSNIETGSQLTALTGGAYNVGTVTYTNPGRIGNCATFTNGALVYPSMKQFADTALESYTVSMWTKLSTADHAHWKSLWQLSSNAYTGLFGIIGIQDLNQSGGDTLALQILNTQVAGAGPQLGGFGCGGCFPGLTTPIDYASDTTSWTLLTTTYNGNGTNEELTVYANGVVLDSVALTNVTKPETFRILPTGGPGTPVPSAWANYVTIGTFNYSDFPVFSLTDGYGNTSSTAASVSGYMANGITGSLDDIRVFNTALTKAQIVQLYTLGTQGK